MAASTITRDTWTNDTGSAASPNLDGTLLNNSVLQNHLYARVDAMFAGAGAYATFTFGGLVAAEGFGTHLFSASGTGGNAFRVRNTSAGTGNYGQSEVMADSATASTSIFQVSSTFTSSGDAVQNGGILRASGSGGLTISTTHASGTLRFFTGGVAERLRIDASGRVFIGDTSDAQLGAQGLCINMGVAVGQSLTFKSSDVSHGSGSIETDTFGYVGPGSAGGQLVIHGLAESGASGALFLEATVVGSGHANLATKSTSGGGYIVMNADENHATPSADENLVVIRSNLSTKFIFDADGDSHQDVGTAWTNFDDHDDVALLHALSAGVSRKGDPLRRAFGRYLTQHRKALTQARIVTFNRDGHHFINWSRAHMLTIGAVRQIGMKQRALEERIARLEAA